MAESSDVEVGPSGAELFAALGRSASAWPSILSGLEERFSPLALEWQATSLAFGRICVVRSQTWVLAYLTPMAGQLLVGVVLSEDAFQAALVARLAVVTPCLMRSEHIAWTVSLRFLSLMGTWIG